MTATEYIEPVLVCSANHTADGVTISFGRDQGFYIPANQVWHVFDCLRTHIEDYGAVDYYNRPIVTEDI